MYVPTACLAHKETANSVRLNGVAISLVRISEECGIDMGYLSRILSGKSKGSASTIQRIANSLGMSMEQFMSSLPCDPKVPSK